MKALARRLREALGEDGDALVGFWLGVLSGEVLTTKTRLDSNGNPTEIDYVMETVSLKDRIAVSTLIADRAFAKAPRFIPIEDDKPADSGPDVEGFAEAFDREMEQIRERRRQWFHDRGVLAPEEVRLEDLPKYVPEQPE